MEMLMADKDVEYVLNVTGSSPRVGTNQAHAQLTVILKPRDKRETDDIKEVRDSILDSLSKYPGEQGLCLLAGYHSEVSAHPAVSRWCLRQRRTRHMLICRMPLTPCARMRRVCRWSRVCLHPCRLTSLSFTLMWVNDRAQMLGIPVSDIFSTMKAFTGSIYVNDFNMFNRIYRVYIQADAPYRMHRDNINLFFVKSSDGTMISFIARHLAFYYRSGYDRPFQYVQLGYHFG